MKRTLVLIVGLVFSAGWARAQELRSPEPPRSRYLVVCMDGIGYELAAEMHRKGELKNFLPPAPLITAFPTLTNTGLVEVFAAAGAPPARGYEDYYFDPQGDRLRGGLFQRFSQKRFVEETYRGLFHYHPNSIRMTLEYGLPVFGPWLNGAVTLGRIKAKFKKSDAPVFLAYFDSSDPAAHLSGQWLLRRQLRALDALVADLRNQVDYPVEVVVFSDHGNHRRGYRRADLKKPLRRAGFRVRGRLQDERSVILPEYGLVSTAVLYTAAGQESAVAEGLRAAEGVDVVAYRQDKTLYVVGRGGTARIERWADALGEWFLYRVESGDPLRLARIVEALNSQGRMAPDGFIAEEDWLRATAGHVYPDPLRRLWGAFDPNLVERPASAIVSLEDGYYAGSRVLDFFAWLLATHGNLRRAQSLGVVLATDPALFLPYRGPFTGRNLLARIAAAHAQTPPRLRLPAAPPEAVLALDETLP